MEADCTSDGDSTVPGNIRLRSMPGGSQAALPGACSALRTMGSERLWSFGRERLHPAAALMKWLAQEPCKIDLVLSCASVGRVSTILDRRCSFKPGVPPTAYPIELRR